MTIVFADVVGSTSLAETMDPEDWRGVISLLFGRAAPAVARYEGTIARILGDALLIYFGAPVAHEDDPVRAIRAALDLLEVVRRCGPEMDSRYGIQLQMRVGIHTGPVVVGDLGTLPAGGVASEYVALGDSMNLAARIESTAQPMTVFVSDDTYRLTAPLFAWQDRGDFELKGKREPVHLWQVVGRREARGSLRGLAGIEARTVGRDAELERLLDTTNALTRDQRGAVVTITGEPGIGKTRLTVEWSARAPDGLGWVRAACLSYGRRLAYHAIVDLMRSTIGASEISEPEEVRSRLSEAVQRYLDGGPVASGVLADLLSLPLLPEEQRIMQALDSQARQVRYIRTIGELLRQRAAEHPVVALIEDVHWADPTSVFVLERLLRLIADAPILFCLTSRPDADAPVWPLLSQTGSAVDTAVVRIDLEPLAGEDMAALVRDLLEAAGVDATEEAAVLTRAEGNPFFAEEIVRMLQEWTGGPDVPWGPLPDGSIPSTIHGLLLARLDSMPQSVRRTARLAAVVGRRFSARLLEEVRAG